ncbi:hypothetical protein CTAYLR_007975 [Chrysophaeum taylorii]|uniref:Aquaporin family protein n=1 Tax=Chrysophaeum taylorii TaxID=2483200 RepID=A0AAD7UA65_9STRA|nr:hypothetical protein CTAYLR_007975 [Chrysophaeum taylorii]
MGASLSRATFAEFLGTLYLVCTIIGSGIMGDTLSEDDGIALLGNTLATWGILFVLITVLGPVSGAHFNPVVSIAFFMKREIDVRTLAFYLPAQFGGGIVGAYVAHAMFMIRNGEFDGKDRDTDGEFFSEAVATLGLLMTIFGCIEAKADVAMGVGLFITAGYWFTSSTSFANPAVTVARSFTDTFASITPKSFQAYFLGQLVGLVVAVPLCEWMFKQQSPANALAALVRRAQVDAVVAEDSAPRTDAAKDKEPLTTPTS